MNIKHLQGPYKQVFMNEGEISEVLNLMEQNASLKTSLKGTAHAIHHMSFHEIHMTYLKEHPKVNPEHYLSNLRTMIKIRPSK